VAVVVNHREVRAADGTTSMVALTAAELDQVRNLVKEAMGFTQARGDSLNVVNSPFSVDTSTVPEPPYWKDPQNVQLAKTAAQYLLIALAMLIAAVALPRLMRRRQSEHRPAELLAAAESADLAQLPAGAALQIAESQRDPVLERQLLHRKADIEFAQQAATQDPRLVASLIRHWMTA
jgi:flagellar M-ring protein FliF